MPIHDWTRVPAGTYHFFHQGWIAAIADALNTGGLPAGYFAMSEVNAKGPIPDVLALKAQPPAPPGGPAGVAVLDTPPRTRVVSRGENTAGYARRAYHLSIYLPQGELIAVIEIVSPGNKDSANGLKSFVRKAGRPLRRGVHLRIVDLFPPSIRDPFGIHKAIWDPFKEEPFDLPPMSPGRRKSFIRRTSELGNHSRRCRFFSLQVVMSLVPSKRRTKHRGAFFRPRSKARRKPRVRDLILHAGRNDTFPPHLSLAAMRRYSAAERVRRLFSTLDDGDPSLGTRPLKAIRAVTEARIAHTPLRSTSASWLHGRLTDDIGNCKNQD